MASLLKVRFLIQKGFLNSTVKFLSSNSSAVASTSEQESTDLTKLSSEEINKRLMTFFDVPENWTKGEVKSGRGWRIEELRIKSNSDLHKLWYILYKERNMLMTMEQAAKDEVENMVSPERLFKVEDSMKNIEEVVKERNRAYWQLEVGDSNPVERRRVFRRDLFGRWRMIASSEHLIPYWMNNEWRKFNAPGFGADVINFNRRLNENRLKRRISQLSKQQFYCQQLLKRFPNIDIDYLQERFPEINIKHLMDNNNEYTIQTRTARFNQIFYHKKKDL